MPRKTKTTPPKKSPSASNTIPDACPYCAGRDVVKSGKRYNLSGSVQLFLCAACKRKFSHNPARHVSFPIHAIIETLSLYNRGYTLEESARRAGKKHRLSISKQLANTWKTRYAQYFPYFRIRNTIASTRAPHDLVLSSRLHHGQVYDFAYHRGKTEHILACSARRKLFHPLQTFLENAPTDTPHDIFRAETPRASQTKSRFSLDKVAIIERSNAAVEMARLVIPTVSRNRKRHETLQDFMLINDSVTVSVEVPAYLTAKDVQHFSKKLGFSIPFTLDAGATVTGHIDILQIRRGMIHILDYKPGAKKDKPIEQLMIYALALSRRTGLRLYHFKCAWFDDEHYYEFYPLHVVHKKRR